MGAAGILGHILLLLLSLGLGRSLRLVGVGGGGILGRLRRVCRIQVARLVFVVFRVLGAFRLFRFGLRRAVGVEHEVEILGAGVIGSAQIAFAGREGVLQMLGVLRSSGRNGQVVFVVAQLVAAAEVGAQIVVHGGIAGVGRGGFHALDRVGNVLLRIVAQREGLVRHRLDIEVVVLADGIVGGLNQIILHRSLAGDGVRLIAQSNVGLEDVVVGHVVRVGHVEGVIDRKNDLLVADGRNRLPITGIDQPDHAVNNDQHGQHGTDDNQNILSCLLFLFRLLLLGNLAEGKTLRVKLLALLFGCRCAHDTSILSFIGFGAAERAQLKCIIALFLPTCKQKVINVAKNSKKAGIGRRKTIDSRKKPRYGRVTPFITCTKRAGGLPLQEFSVPSVHLRSKPRREVYNPS